MRRAHEDLTGVPILHCEMRHSGKTTSYHIPGMDKVELEGLFTLYHCDAV